MSSGISLQKAELTLEARKHLLLVACTLDRVNLVAKLRPAPTPLDWYSQLSSLPWFETATNVAERMAPRKLRLLVTFWRAWSRLRRRR